MTRRPRPPRSASWPSTAGRPASWSRTSAWPASPGPSTTARSAMQKQSRVFFQISGAGHEALRPGPGPPPAPGLRLVLPLLPRPGAVPRARGHAHRGAAAGGGLGRRPELGRPPDAVALGQRARATSSPSRARPAASASRRSAAPRPAATSCAARTCPAAPPTATSSPTSASARAPCSEGEFWESLNTACTLHLPVLYVVADNGYAISVPAVDQHPAPVHRAGARASAGSRSRTSTAPTTSRCGETAQRLIEHVRAGVGPALLHAEVVRPYSHSAADTQSKYRPVAELADEATPRPDRPARGRRSSTRAR